jgi:DNA-binding XRE family transcriptional regulator
VGTNPRPKPQRRAEKLLAIRREIKASQSEMAALLGHAITPARVSECENGKREANLLVLLAYAKLARVKVELLIDDKLELAEKIQSEVIDSCRVVIAARKLEGRGSPDPGLLVSRRFA